MPYRLGKICKRQHGLGRLSEVYKWCPVVWGDCTVIWCELEKLYVGVKEDMRVRDA